MMQFVAEWFDFEESKHASGDVSRDEVVSCRNNVQEEDCFCRKSQQHVKKVSNIRVEFKTNPDKSKVEQVDEGIDQGSTSFDHFLSSKQSVVVEKQIRMVFDYKANDKEETEVNLNVVVDSIKQDLLSVDPSTTPGGFGNGVKEALVSDDQIIIPPTSFGSILAKDNLREQELKT